MPPLPIPATDPLQWGRNFIVAEITQLKWAPIKLTYKLQWGRNFIVAEISHVHRQCTATDTCFNGAATLSLRKSAVPRPHLAHSSAGFNGAATLSLRKSDAPCVAVWSPAVLQWGRNFIVAEIDPKEDNDVITFLASMGPQLYRCGNEPTQRRRPVKRVASMGPQLYRCGNSISLSKFSRSYLSLQWGRNFIVAEMHRSSTCSYLLKLLQWGRNFIVAEM